jgi:predicted nucleotidyltransferase
LFEGRNNVEERVFLEVLGAALDAIEATGIPHALMGGVATSCLGRPRWTHDIDVFVCPNDAEVALEALERAGFATQRTNPHWLYKGVRDGVLVDVLFRSTGDIFLDQEMIARLVVSSFKGRRLKVVPPEDLVVIKALAHDEESPRHWFDALSIISARIDIDWDYLLRRALRGPRRVLSLLLYATSVDLVVPERAVRALFDTIIGGPSSAGGRSASAPSVAPASSGGPA